MAGACPGAGRRAPWRAPAAPPGVVVIERLVARIPALLTVVLLALLAWIALVQADQPSRLLAGAPLALVLLLYVQSGRGRAG